MSPNKKRSRNVNTLHLASGTYKRSKKGFFGSDGVRVCTAFKFVSHLTDLENNRTYLVVAFRNSHGDMQRITIPKSLLANPKRMIEQLMDKGWEVDNIKQAVCLIRELHQSEPPTRNTWQVSSPGWHEITSIKDIGPLFYVANNGAYCSDGKCNQLVLETCRDSKCNGNGSLQEWNENVAQLCRGNPKLQLAVCAAFAGPIVTLAKQSNFGLHIAGPSRTGKSTALNVAASIYGDRSFVHGWDATVNALGALALSKNDAILILDEIGEADPKVVFDVVYPLINGRERRRLGPNNYLQPGRSFSGVVLTNGEYDLRSYLQSGGITAKAGQLARLISIPVFQRHGMFKNLHGHSNGGEVARTLNENATRYYGIAGPAFIQNLLVQPALVQEKIRLMINEYAKVLMDTLPNHSQTGNGKEDSVSQSMALVACAGELAIEQGVLAWVEGEALKAVKTCFKAWAKLENKYSNEAGGDVWGHLRLFFQSESGGKFAEYGNYAKAQRNTLAGFRHIVDGVPVFLVYPAYFETMLCKSFGKKAGILALKSKQLLVLGSRGTPTKQFRLPKEQGRERISFYVIHADILTS